MSECKRYTSDELLCSVGRPEISKLTKGENND